MVNLSEGLVYAQNVLSDASEQAKGLLGNPVVTGVGGAVVGGAIVGTIAAATSARKKSTRKASVKRSSKARKSRSRNYKYARTAGKRRDTSTRRIRMTKNGQPYVILKSGKARFISKASARASRRRKGGRY